MIGLVGKAYADKEAKISARTNATWIASLWITKQSFFKMTLIVSNPCNYVILIDMKLIMEMVVEKDECYPIKDFSLAGVHYSID